MILNLEIYLQSPWHSYLHYRLRHSRLHSFHLVLLHSSPACHRLGHAHFARVCPRLDAVSFTPGSRRLKTPRAAV
jgi:hypothetical protein